MTNKPILVCVLLEPVPVLTGNLGIDWAWVWRIPTFLIGYGDEYVDVYILVISLSI